MSEETTTPVGIKIVITITGESACIGIQQTNCDPVFSQAKGDIAAILTQAATTLEAAKKTWETNPRYPKADIPIPAAPAPTSAAAHATSNTAAKTTQNKSQVAMF